jgi:hypothetical protein
MGNLPIIQNELNNHGSKGQKGTEESYQDSLTKKGPIGGNRDEGKQNDGKNAKKGPAPQTFPREGDQEG